MFYRDLSDTNQGDRKHGMVLKLDKEWTNICEWKKEWKILYKAGSFIVWMARQSKLF